MIETYIVENGCAIFRKVPGASQPYGLDLTDWLDGRTLMSVSATAVGVTIKAGTVPYILDNCVAAVLEGLDTADGADNSCTFDFDTDDGSDSRTIKFVKR